MRNLDLAKEAARKEELVDQDTLGVLNEELSRSTKSPRCWQCRHRGTESHHKPTVLAVPASWQHTIISPRCWQCRHRGSSSYH